MGAGAFIEPLVVISLLAGGTWINRARQNNTTRSLNHHKRIDSPALSGSETSTYGSEEGLLTPLSRSSSPAFLNQGSQGKWRKRTVGLFWWNHEISTPNTAVFADRLLSRLLRRLPFLVEVWYWALIYWVYQLGRAFTALTLNQGTVLTAREHALQLIRLEQRLGIFWEPEIQRWFLQYPFLMHWINRIYSFIHIPGTILFLIWLYYLTITAESLAFSLNGANSAGSGLYQSRRRTMAMCNLLAFVVFTLWPCMPPRLLSDPTYNGLQAYLAKSFGFVDTVHGPEGESSVWTTNKFCNQYAAMPSLHFGYSLLIGISIALVPLASDRGRRASLGFGPLRVRLLIPAWKRLVCIGFGIAYPTVILVAIVATANHFILDAVAGGLLCGIAWKSESLLLNLLPLEDCFLWCLRLHKPDLHSSNASLEEKTGGGLPEH